MNPPIREKSGGAKAARGSTEFILVIQGKQVGLREWLQVGIETFLATLLADGVR